ATRSPQDATTSRPSSVPTASGSNSRPGRPTSRSSLEVRRPPPLRPRARDPILDADAGALVARRAACLDRFVEMRDDRLVAAAAALDEVEEVHRGLLLEPPDVRVLDLAEEALVQLDVRPGVEEETIAREPVPPGAADLLVPRLDVLRH